MNVVTAAECDDYLSGLITDQTPAGGTPESVIADVSSRLAQYTGRRDWGGQESRTQYFDGGTQFLLTHYWPIISITSIHDDIDRNFDTSSLLNSDEYFISQNSSLEFNNGVIMFKYARLTQGYLQNVKVIYTGGYNAVSDIPANIKRAAYLQIAYEIQVQQPGRFPSFPGRLNADNYDPFQGIGLLDQVKALIAPYCRRIPFA